MQDYCTIKGNTKVKKRYKISTYCTDDGNEVTKIYENGKLKSHKINDIEQLNRHHCIIM